MSAGSLTDHGPQITDRPAILYCGDTELTGAAAYLAGLITRAGWSFDYVPSHLPLTPAQVGQGRKLFIFSDYPALQAAACQELVLAQVAAGAGLLMIGGWESFHGLGGDWDGTPVGISLGVDVRHVDDRCNSATPAVLIPTAAGVVHPILQGLPWQTAPAFIGGWNLVDRGPGSELLTIQPYREVRIATDGGLTAFPAAHSPGLVVHQHQQGRTAVFLSDVAPHWVGSFVDWGPHRITAQAAGGPAIEVGSWYAQFWEQLLRWVGRL
jgi:uncharacterized membrane protein